jgi:enolase
MAEAPVVNVDVGGGVVIGESEASAYGALGVTGAVKAVLAEVAPRLVGVDAAGLAACDGVLHDIDGTPNFDRLGSNTASAVSTAVALAAADALGVPFYALVGADTPTLPRPLGNIIGGRTRSPSTIAPTAPAHPAVARQPRGGLAMTAEARA